MLVVDDDPDIRAIWSECLSHVGYRTATASDGADGLRRAAAQHPALILMDLAMPRMDGLEATRRIKAEPRLLDCLVILVTAYGRPEMFAQARAAGCDAYFRKPFDPFLLDGILRAFRSARASSRLSSAGKRCLCGRTYPRSTWPELELHGKVFAPRRRHGQWGDIEVRLCSCGVAMVVATDHPPGKPRGTE